MRFTAPSTAPLHRTFPVLAALVLWTCLAQGISAGGLPVLEEQAVRDVEAAVRIDPFDKEIVDRFVEGLPQAGNNRVVFSGKVLEVKEVVQEMARLYDLNRSSSQPPSLAAETLWPETERHLSFFVERDSFASLDSPDAASLVAQLVEQAGQDWSDICPECGLRFQREDDASAAVMRVRLDPTTPVLTSAFFPDAPPEERILTIGPSFFNPDLAFDRRGLLRHELGHVLGYQHPVCETNEVQPSAEGRRPHQPSPSPLSVMSYGCAEQRNFTFDITDADAIAHREYYGFGTLVVSFELGEMTSNSLRVLDNLHAADLLPVGRQAVPKHSNLCTLFHRLTGLPDIPEMTSKVNGCNPRVFHFIRKLNPGISLDQELEHIHLPEIRFQPYDYSIVFDPEFATDSQKLERILKFWPSLVSERQESKNGLVRLSLKGFLLEIPLRSAEAEAQGSKALQRLGRTNVYYTTRTQSPKAQDYFSYFEPQAFLEGCQTETLDACAQGDYGKLVRREGPWSGLSSPCPGVHAPSFVPPVVHLFDTPVFHNPDLRGAILRGGNSRSTVADNPQCEALDSHQWEKELHHGTHLAGIVLAQDEVPCGKGFVGLAPRARLHSYDRNVLDDRGIASAISRAVDFDQPPAIALFASQFPYEGRDKQHLVAGSNLVLNNSDARMKAPLPARRLAGTPNLLWVSAAGQIESSSDGPRQSNPTQITSVSALSPANLGDQRHVVVVTACTECLSSDPKIWERANYSKDGLVHLAAPSGQPIVGLADGKLYSSQKGTSQAAAFVAGAAAAMMTCFPAYEDRPYLVKTRLQTTSFPVTHPEHRHKVATGVVDLEAALLAPNEDYLAHGGNKGEVVTRRWGWCRNGLELKFEGQSMPDGTVKTQKIYRILSIEKDVLGTEWVVYRQRANGFPTDAVVERMGPATGSADADQPLIWIAEDALDVADLANGDAAPQQATLLRFAQIDDLLIGLKSQPKVLVCSGG